MYILFISDNRTLNNFIKMFFGNANFAGAMFAFFLDNTVPGERTFYYLLCNEIQKNIDKI